MAEIKTGKKFGFLKSISTIDGRFRGRTEKIAEYFSEYASYKYRIGVEIKYLLALGEKIKLGIDKKEAEILRQIYINFNEDEAMQIWIKDEEINHDSKAVEYYLQGKLSQKRLGRLINYIHFGLTSSDIDNTALSLAMADFKKEILIPAINKLKERIRKMAKDNQKVVMAARTHGQIAVPTTAGKEIANYYSRIEREYKKIAEYQMGSKMNGAVGNYNALMAAYPEINWRKFFDEFLGKLGLESLGMSTQVEGYERKIEYIQIIKRLNSIIEGMAVDMWRYLALGYLSGRDEAGHVGSSTMPQKINPIGLEMAENYLNLANSIFEVMERRLPKNRWQRDLTDKYLLREMGAAMADCVLGYESAEQALGQVGFNKKFIKKELNDHWELVAEGIQTVLRRYGYERPYEMMKDFSRGKKVTKKRVGELIEKLEVNEEVKEKLRQIRPENYVGLAEELAKTALNE